MKKGVILIANLFLVLFVCFLAWTVVQNLFFNPRPAFAGAWGDKYTNDEGKIICVCDPTEKDCAPCIIIP
ncbi:hypothetical protein NLB65_00180 [Candidatus Aminicenantes bacterium AC-335-B20]|jgi:hypothetical protein|nr:hypothetical protein [SCandidatus Aminicenantes bacterium Aminicenantia_JdfR_composite]MCP2598548.1 hypothetical protein [Candidatus Aminicenantes bacterium AC-335-L06]MCP2598861.1 hypothetical protein [Candidatus Aminicenantes bacterium AC-335-B20]